MSCDGCKTQIPIILLLTVHATQKQQVWARGRGREKLEQIVLQGAGTSTSVSLCTIKQACVSLRALYVQAHLFTGGRSVDSGSAVLTTCSSSTAEILILSS